MFNTQLLSDPLFQTTVYYSTDKTEKMGKRQKQTARTNLVLLCILLVCPKYTVSENWLSFCCLLDEVLSQEHKSRLPNTARHFSQSHRIKHEVADSVLCPSYILLMTCVNQKFACRWRITVGWRVQRERDREGWQVLPVKVHLINKFDT